MVHQVSPPQRVGQHPLADAGLATPLPMAMALDAARKAAAEGEVPVGAVVTDSQGLVLAVAGNRMVADRDASAHAECLAMRMAVTRLSMTDPAPDAGGKLIGCDLWVTLEPCAMCAATAGLFRIRRLIFGAYDAKGGAVEHNARVFATSPNMHRPEVTGGFGERESAALLKQFFSVRR